MAERYVEPPTAAQVNAGFEMSLEAYGRVYLRAAMRNLAAVARLPTVNALAGVARGTPAVLVAAGPSLDRNVEHLQRFKGRALIICINQSLRALRAAGVEPDVCLAVDPLNMAYHFDGKPVPVLGVCPSVCSEVLRLGESVFTFPASRDSEAWMYQAMGAPVSWGIGNSVAHHALHLALHMGCSPIVVVGQDFALSGEQYYASNAGDGAQRLVPEGDTLSTKAMYDRPALAAGDAAHFNAVAVPDTLKLVKVPGWGGVEAVTTTDLYPMLQLYGRIVTAGHNVRCINATEGGARIHGMEEMRLLDALRLVEICEKPHTAGIFSRIRGVDIGQAVAFRQSLKAHRKTLQHLGQLADSLLSRTERGPSRTREEFAKAAAECEFFQVWCVRELRAIRDNPRTHAVHVAALEKNLYTATKQLCDEVGEKLRQAATGLAHATNSPPSLPQVTTNVLTPLA